MRSRVTKLICLFATCGAADLAGAQYQQPSNTGPTGSVYSNPNAPRPLPPLVQQATVNYDTAVGNYMPLTPEQIKVLRGRLDKTKRAAAASPTVPPKPVYSVKTVDLSPGAPPPIVRVSNLGAAVTFIDATGAPWDLLEVNNMSSERFDVVHPVAAVPAITITPKGDYVEGDVAVFLKDLPFPVVIKMIAGQKETDYRLDIRVPRRGPNAVQPIQGVSAIDLPKASLQSLLDGIDTPDAKPLRIDSGPTGMQAWIVGDHIVLRTSLFLNNPAYTGSLTSADGTHVYEIPKTPVVTVSENGALRNVIFDLE
jgi:intracellular multiplication protein IcmK